MIDPRRAQLWYQHGVLYHIYPLSFADSTGDGFGDLRGIINHLDYLNDGTAESLGVSAIWLSPIYRSPMADWGYDVADHCTVDPRFGTMADFDELVAAVHQRGMKLLMDYVPNHTSVQHAWFTESRASRENAKRDWYIWADPKADGSPPNNWLSRFGGPAWTLDETTGQYYLHSFLAEQPDLNWRKAEVREAMLKILQFWLDRGIDGFRADAVDNLGKDTGFRDDPPNPRYRPGRDREDEAQLRVYSARQPGVGEALGAICEVLDQRPGRYMLSEAYLNLAELLPYYDACRAHPIHAPFNFNLMKLKWGAAIYRSFIDEYEAGLGADDWPNYVLGNLDNPRLVARVGLARARLLALLQLTLRGLPVIYYGDELGLPQARVPADRVRDTLELRSPGFGRDGARSPMPWTGELNGGFTEGTPWLPLSPGVERNNVAAQDADPGSFLNLYRRLIHLRASSPALSDGDYRSLKLDNPQVYGFVRETNVGRCHILLNFSDELQTVTLGAIGQWIVGTHDLDGDGRHFDGGALTLEPYEGRLYESQVRAKR